MQFRKSGQREDRRRRVLSEERAATTDPQASTGSADSSAGDSTTTGSGRQGRAYSEMAHPERQPRVIDFVPTRAWVLALWLLAGVAVLAGVLTLHAQLGTPRDPFTAEELAPFQLTSRGSLASWYGAWLLAGAACGCLLLYTLRRHRVDDYRGYYRVWLWAGALLMLASIDAVAGLHLALRRLLVVASGTTLHASGDLWWIVVLGTVYAVLGIRLLFEVKASRGTFAAILLAGVGYGLAIAARFVVFAECTPAMMTMIEHGSLLAGHLLALLAVGVNLRYVLLDIQGLIPPRAERPRKERRRKKSAATSAAAADDEQKPTRKRTTRRSDLEPAAKSASEAKSTSTAKSSNTLKVAAKSRGAVAASNAARQSSASDSDEDSVDTVAAEAHEIGMDPAAYASLSKSERRRVRKQHRRGRRAA